MTANLIELGEKFQNFMELYNEYFGTTQLCSSTLTLRWMATNNYQ